MISNEDLRELGIPMGPRKKLASFISSQGDKIRAARVSGYSVRRREEVCITLPCLQERRACVEAERRAREKQLMEATQRQARLQGVKFVKGAAAGTGQPHINFPQLRFKAENLFALGSPIGLFLIVR